VHDAAFLLQSSELWHVAVW